MTDIIALVNTVATLFIIIVISCIATKFKIINEQFIRGFSTFIICVTQPFMIMNALSGVEFSADNLKSGFTVTGIGFITMLIGALVAKLAVARFRSADEKKIGQFGIIFANAGFMGIPVLKATFGAIGAFYGAFFQITFHLTLWTYGMYILAKGRDDIKIKPVNMLVNYGTIPVILGIILYLLPFEMPEPVKMTMDMLGSVCAPGSMVIVGSIIAGISVKDLILDKKIYLLAAVKLLVLPSVVCLIASFCGLSGEFVYLFTLLTALPTATNCAMYAQKYDIVPEFGAKMASVSTVLSMLTVPLMMKLASLLIPLRDQLLFSA